MGTKRLFCLQCSDFMYELAKKIQILLLQAKEGTGQVGRAKAYDFHIWSSNNPDMHLKHRCDLQVGQGRIRKCKRRGGEGEPALGCCQCTQKLWLGQAAFAGGYLRTDTLYNWLEVVKLISWSRYWSPSSVVEAQSTGFQRMSTKWPQSRQGPLAAAAAQSYFVEGAALEICLKTESSLPSSFVFSNTRTLTGTFSLCKKPLQSSKTVCKLQTAQSDSVLRCKDFSL